MSQFTAVTDRPTILRIMASKRRRELICTIVWAVIVIPGIAYVMVAKQVGRGPGLPLLGLLLVALIGSAYSYVNSRCPACDTAIGSAVRRARFCPGCGAQLVPDEKLVKPAAPPAERGAELAREELIPCSAPSLTAFLRASRMPPIQMRTSVRFASRAFLICLPVLCACLPIGCGDKGAEPGDDNHPPSTVIKHLWSQRFGDGSHQLAYAVAGDVSGMVSWRYFPNWPHPVRHGES